MGAKKKILLLCIMIVAAALITVAVIILFHKIPAPTTVAKFPYKENRDVHPMKGYMPFAKFYPLKEAFSPEIYSNITLWYAGIPWAQIEPEQGKYDFDKIEEIYHLETLKKSHYRIVLRVLADQPNDEGDMYIPRWLYESINKQGSFYDINGKKGFSPDYDHPAMISAHEKLLQAIKDHYGEDFIGYIQMGTIGQYGEWHTGYGGKMPTEETMQAYAQQYREVFPNTPLLYRRPFQASLQGPAGYYNDMLGAKKSTDQWLSWLLEGDDHTGSYPLPKFWQRGPIGGEFSHGDPYSPVEDDRYRESLRQIEVSHMTFIGPCMPMEPENEVQMKNAQEILQKLGYDIFLSQAEFPVIFVQGENTIRLRMENCGLAPLFMDLEIVANIKDSAGTTVAETMSEIDLSKVKDGDYYDYTLSFPVDNLREEELYELIVYIRDPWTKKCFPISNAAEKDGHLKMGNLRYIPEYTVWELLKEKISHYF